ncbi:Las1-like-domain-containing protein [Chytriomyces cf. hyalinus JEL632]|nr:Las1-like-domain-containing protein [Chytriomyces cf. hyalinus JEL632]
MRGVTGRVVPWSDFTEWEQVRYWLFTHQHEGVRRVKAWASRGKVPAAVDATAVFVEVLLTDQAGRVSEHELRMLYSMAFVRFVNGVVDSQQKGLYAGSVAGIAESLGLPTWFVDLRHAGTHDRLPSISLLRAGCLQALDWLNANYWVVQTTYVNSTASDVRQLLLQYVEQSQTESANAMNCIREIGSLILADNYRDFLIPCLLEPGFLVPDVKKLRSKYNDLTLNASVQTLWSEPLNVFEKTWPGFCEDLLVALVGTALIDPLKTGTLKGSVGTSGNAAAAAAGDEVEKNPTHSMSYQATIASWARHILESHVLNRKQAAASEDLNDAIDLVLEACFSNPNIFTRHILSDISRKQPSLKPQLQPFISFVDSTFKSAVLSEKLATVATSASPSTNPTKRRKTTKAEQASDAPLPPTLRNPADFEAELKLLRDRVCEIEAVSVSLDSDAKMSSFEPMTVDGVEGGDATAAAATNGANCWKLASDQTWARVPLGHVPGVGLPQLDLDLQLDSVEFARTIGVLVVPSVFNAENEENGVVGYQTEVPDMAEHGEALADGGQIRSVAKRIRLLG